ncbi:MAG: hypothetical protein FWF08_01525 [Oscillospiraceae bacterium]|nr:hypothetical protein [Oscillospiraceae bacterium]
MFDIDVLWDQFLKVFRVIVAFFMAPLILLSGASASVMKLYGEGAITATRQEYVFDNDRLLLGAYNNGLSGDYSVLPGLAKEAGLDFLVSWVNEEFMDYCEAAGIGVIAKGYNAHPSFMSFTEETKALWMGLTNETYNEHPALWGDDFVDEPFTEHFADMGEAINHYHSLNTGRMPYINLLPIHVEHDSLVPLWMRIFLFETTYVDSKFDAYRQHIGAYIKSIDTDYISVDIYPYNVKDTNGDWLDNLDMLAEACRDTGRDLWVITQAAGNAVEHIDGSNKRYPDQKCHQLQQGYASMAFGAKAIIYACLQDGWWDPASRMLTAGGGKTDTYYAVQAANADFAPFSEKYGEYKWLGAYPVNALKVTGIRYPCFSNGLPKNEQLAISSKDGLVVGCFDEKEGGGKAYIVANMYELLDQKAASCTIAFPEGKKVTVYGGGEIKAYENGGNVQLALGPGDGRFITVD